MTTGTTDQPTRGDRAIGLIASETDAALIARRLADTHKRVLHYMLPPAAKLAAGPYLEAASTPADIAIECDLIAVAIDDTRVLRDLILGTAERPGIGADLRPGATLIDFGIRPPREAQSILGLLGMRAVSVVDAAIIGSADALANGRASVLAGGFPDAVDAAMPVLRTFGAIERTGPLGSAQTAAALMGYVEAARIAARAEAMSVGEALGLKPPALAHILDDGKGESNVIRFERRAELARKLAAEGACAGENVIAFRRLARVEATSESS